METNEEQVLLEKVSEAVGCDMGDAVAYVSSSGKKYLKKLLIKWQDLRLPDGIKFNKIRPFEDGLYVVMLKPISEREKKERRAKRAEISAQRKELRNEVKSKLKKARIDMKKHLLLVSKGKEQYDASIVQNATLLEQLFKDVKGVKDVTVLKEMIAADIDKQVDV